MGSPPWGWVPEASQAFTTFLSCALASCTILPSSRANWPQPSHLNPTAERTVSMTQHFLLLQQFSRCGDCPCIPQRGMYFFTQALSFSVAVWHSLHFSPSSWAVSRHFLHLGHQVASSTVATSHGGPGFFSSCGTAAASDSAQRRPKAIL